MSGVKHGVTFEVIRRDEITSRATSWRATCACKVVWIGPTYEIAEDEWRQHVAAATGKVPPPMGNLEGRWTA